jgi:hypothetical protein
MMIIFKVHKGVISLHFYGLHFANWSKYILVIIRVLTYFDIFCVGMLGNSSHIYFAFLFQNNNILQSAVLIEVQNLNNI